MMTRLRIERMRKGWTQAHLAVASDVKLAQIRRFEQHPEVMRKASYETVRRIADALGITTEELVSIPEGGISS